MRTLADAMAGLQYRVLGFESQSPPLSRLAATRSGGPPEEGEGDVGGTTRGSRAARGEIPLRCGSRSFHLYVGDVGSRQTCSRGLLGASVVVPAHQAARITLDFVLSRRTDGRQARQRAPDGRLAVPACKPDRNLLAPADRKVTAMTSQNGNRSFPRVERTDQ